MTTLHLGPVRLLPRWRSDLRLVSGVATQKDLGRRAYLGLGRTGVRCPAADEAACTLPQSAGNGQAADRPWEAGRSILGPGNCHWTEAEERCCNRCIAGEEEADCTYFKGPSAPCRVVNA